MDLKVFLSWWYVDDNTMVSTRIPRGWRYNTQLQRMEWMEVWEIEDNCLEPDVVTARVMASIMSSVDEDTQLTFDSPGNNPNKKMPVLDLQIWMERDQTGANVIRFTFYEKPMASDYVIMKSSGLSWQTKRSTLAGEVTRRRLNMDELSWQEEGVQVLEKFNMKMLRSGYSEYERGIFIQEGLARFNNIMAKVNRGDRPL